MEEVKMDIARADLIALLHELGLELWQAEQAADDPRLDWDVSAVQRCIQFWQSKQGSARNPTAVLWSQLSKHHTIPRGAAPSLHLITEDDSAPFFCPWCKQDWAICEGMHGWPARERDRQRAERAAWAAIPRPRPRRSRFGGKLTT